MAGTKVKKGKKFVNLNHIPEHSIFVFDVGLINATNVISPANGQYFGFDVPGTGKHVVFGKQHAKVRIPIGRRITNCKCVAHMDIGDNSYPVIQAETKPSRFSGPVYEVDASVLGVGYTVYDNLYQHIVNGSGLVDLLGLLDNDELTLDDESEYVKAILGSTDEQTKRIRQAIDQNRAAQRQQQNTMRRLLDTEKELLNQLELVHESGPGAEKNAREEFRRIVESDEFRSLKIVSGQLIAETQRIIVENRGERYDMGVWQINITLSDGRVRYNQIEDSKNKHKDAPNNGHSHPHGENAGICWGNVGGAIIKLGQSKEYAALLHLVKNFIEQPEESHFADWNRYTRLAPLPKNYKPKIENRMKRAAPKKKSAPKKKTAKKKAPAKKKAAKKR